MTAPERRGPERPGPDYPREWDDEPAEVFADADDHDDAHPVWVEGCDGCIDRADLLEQQWRDATRAPGSDRP